MTLGQAATAMGKSRKTLQRWRKAGAPFRPGAKGRTLEVDVDELRAWVEAQGLGEPHRPRKVDRLLAPDVAPAPPPPADESGDMSEKLKKLSLLALARVAQKGSGVASASAARTLLAQSAPAPAAPAPEGGEALTREEEDALALLMETASGADKGKILELARTLPPRMMRRLSALGKTRRDLADADRKELDNRARRGLLVPLDGVRRFWRQQTSMVHARFRPMVAQVAKAGVGLDYDELYELLEREVHQVLSSLAEEVPAI